MVDKYILDRYNGQDYNMSWTFRKNLKQTIYKPVLPSILRNMLNNKSNNLHDCDWVISTGTLVCRYHTWQL